MQTRTVDVIMTITCKLDQEYFGPWEKLTLEQQAVFDDKSADCDGAGDFGPWCVGCDFCKDWDVEDDDY